MKRTEGRVGTSRRQNLVTEDQGDLDAPMTGTGGRPQNKAQSTLRSQECEIRTMPVAIGGAYALGNNSNIQKRGNEGAEETAQMLGIG